MSLKPPVITQDQLVEQVRQMDEQKQQLERALEQLQTKLQAIEKSLGENDQLKHKVQELMAQSYHQFTTEWHRRTEHYPEIRRKILEKTVDLIAPPPATKK